MRCLWLTRKYPRPANSGELIFSDGLIRAFAATGVTLTVVAHDNDEAPVGNRSEASQYEDDQGVDWRLGSPEMGGRLMSLLTSLPSDSYRLMNGGPQHALEAALEMESWDAVIFDHAAMGWGLDVIHRLESSGRPRPRIIYVSHNHEARVRREVARESFGLGPKRWAAQWDAEKYARLEERLCREADLVTGITDFEIRVYREKFPDQEYLCLTPGYDGPAYPDHQITEETPRRVLMSGSFEWIAKQINLERFLEQASAPLADAGIELQIAGKTPGDFQSRMLRKFPTVDFVGRVPEMSPYLLGARMGLIVEEFGGGFKLKMLDYVFHSLPIAALDHALEGLPVESGKGAILAPDTPALIQVIIENIDDIKKLNAIRQNAYDTCVDYFPWEKRGRDLFEAIEKLPVGLTPA